MKRLFFTTIILIAIKTLSAQPAKDAVLLSQYISQGTARSQAMAGAVGAMGNDFGCVATNPAGLGLYRSRGEFTLTPALSFSSAASTYFGQTEKATKSNFNLSNMDIVLSREQSNYGTLRFWQIGFGLNRTYNFNQNTLARGNNANSSIVDSFFGDIDGISIDELTDNYNYLPAWSTYIIDTMNDAYTTPVPQGNLAQTRSLKSSGHTDEWTLAGSMNLIDKVFLGAAIGIAHINRTNNYSFTEENLNSGEFFSEWTNSERVGTSGVGLNARIGIIAFPTRWLRIGLAYHTPTSYTLKETWEPSATSVLNGHTYSSSSDLYTSYTYNLRTPHKFGANLAFIIGSKGLITADYEFLNYRQATFSANDWDYTGKNEEIKSVGRAASNFRIGTEWVLGNVYLRGGFAFYGSPYQDGEEKVGNTFVYSTGIGYPITSKFIIDLAYSFINGSNALFPYRYEGISTIGENHMRHNAALSLKLKW